MTTSMNYDYMPGLDGGMNAYGRGNNEELNNLLDFSQADGSVLGMNDMFDFGDGGSIFTPNGMNINGGMITNSFGDNNMFRTRSKDAPASYTHHALPGYDPSSSGFPFTQQVDPSIIMDPGQSANAASYNNGQTQSGNMAPAQGSGVSLKHSQEPEDVPKPKRTRQSKKKKLTQDQEEKKRKEFLERNRQAASKCRTRKQETNLALQNKVAAYSQQNQIMKQEVAMLGSEIANLKKMLLGHANCTDPELQARIERHEKVYQNQTLFGDGSPASPQSVHSFGSILEQTMSSPAMDSPVMGMDILNSAPGTPSWDMQRVGSGMSSTSQKPYHPFGESQTLLRADQMARAERKKQLAEQEEYMKEYRRGNKEAQEEYETAMSRQISRSSKASSSSPGSSRSDQEGSSYTSAITTPETSVKEHLCPADSPEEPAVRRGIPQKTLGNPRTGSLFDPNLPGLSPTEYLAQH